MPKVWNSVFLCPWPNIHPGNSACQAFSFHRVGLSRDPSSKSDFRKFLYLWFHDEMRKKEIRIHQYLLLGANEMCHISAKKKKRKNATRIFFHNRFQAWEPGSRLVCLAAWHDRVRGQAFAVSRIALPQRPTIKRIPRMKSALRTKTKVNHPVPRIRS